MSRPLHALIGLTTPNLGDDLQALAVAMHVPYASALVHRERLSKRQVVDPHVLVMNYWFMSQGWRKPPHPTIKPVWHGFCVGRDELLQYGWVDYLKAHEPIGCRDTHSVAALEARGVAAYWSGCVTLFLGRKVEPVPPEQRQGVLFVDVAPEAESLIPRALTERAERITNLTPEAHRYDPVARWHAIARLCDRFRRAEIVVTRRLHVALPCASFGVPVALVVNNNPRDVRRFSGYEDFIPFLVHDNGVLVRGIDWDKVGVPSVPADLVAHYEALKTRLGEVFGPLPEGRAKDIARTCKFRLPNPGFGVKTGEIEIDLGVAKVRRVPVGWSDRSIDLEIDAFAGFERFDLPVAVRAPGAWSFTPAGHLADFAV